MKRLVIGMLMLPLVLLSSCDEAKKPQMRPWQELPVAYHFSREASGKDDLSEAAVVKPLFQEELEKAEAGALERPFFVRGVFSSGQPKSYYTWICRVPANGELELMLEAEAHPR